MRAKAALDLFARFSKGKPGPSNASWSDDDRLVGTPEAQRLFGVSNSTWYAKIAADPDFPMPVRIGSVNKWWRSELRSYAERKRDQTKE